MQECVGQDFIATFTTKDELFSLIYVCTVQPDASSLVCTIDTEQSTGTNDNYFTYNLCSFKTDLSNIFFDSVSLKIGKQLTIAETAQEEIPEILDVAKTKVKINLLNDITTCPELFYLKNENFKLENCDYTPTDGSVSGYCSCSFPVSSSKGEYNIYYYNGCEFVEIGVTVTVSDPSMPISVVSYTLMDGSMLTLSEINVVKFTISSALSGELTEMILTDGIIDYILPTCSIDGLLGSCSCNGGQSINSHGSYYLKSLTGPLDTFSVYEVNELNFKLEYVDDYLDVNAQTKKQEVNNDSVDNLAFVIKLKNPTQIPKIFYGDK